MTREVPTAAAAASKAQTAAQIAAKTATPI